MNSNTIGTIPYYIEHLDLYRFNGPQYEESLRDYFAEKYRNQPIGTIISIGPGGLRVAVKLRTSLWPAIPIVFVAVDEETARTDLPPGVTGVAVHFTLANAIDVARKLVPVFKRLAIVGDRFQDQLYYRHFAREIARFAANYEFIDLTGLPIELVKRRVAALPDDSAILYIGINSTGERTYASGAEALPIIADAANRPIIVDVETLLGSGAIGGLVLSPDRLGRAAGRLALQILDGKSVSDIPITVGSALTPIFDWRQLQRWNIDESLLPAGSEIRYREPSVWDRYHAQILVATSILILQAALIVWLIYDHRRRHKAEIVAQNAMSEVAQLNRTAAAGELAASIAHEVNQPLMGVVANANAAMRWLAADPVDLNKVRDALTQIVTAGHHASDVIASIRAMFANSSQERQAVDINSLIRAVLRIVSADMNKYGVIQHLSLDEHLPTVDGDPTQLQQTLLNLIVNAIEAMHASYPRVMTIRSSLTGQNTVLVSVEDTGVGIASSNADRVFKPLFTTKTHGMGVGLAICRTIIENHNGRIWVLPGAKGGAVFQFELPTSSTGAVERTVNLQGIDTKRVSRLPI